MKDLTKGSPFKLIVLFALPVFFGSVFQQLYNMADTVIVGHTVGADALTGVGITGVITFLVLGFANGLTAGFGVHVAQRFGAGDGAGVRRSVAMSLLLGGTITLLLTAVAVPCSAPLLRLINTPEQYFPYAESYLTVIFAGIGASVLYNLGANILRGVGDSKAPLLFLVVAAALNVGLDFAFILGAKLYYIGAALATVVSQILSGAACFVYMAFRYGELRLSRSDFRPDLPLAGRLLALGFPMALQFSITAIGSLFQQAALNGLDETLPGVATAYAAASKIDAFASQGVIALGTALANYVGQNTGAENYARVKRGVFAGVVYLFAASAAGFAFGFGLSRPLMLLFLKTDVNGFDVAVLDRIVAYGREYLFIQTGLYPLVGVIYVFRSTLQGMGKSAITTFSGVMELGGRALTALVFVRIWGFLGFCFSNATAWLFADVFLLIVYFIVDRKFRRGTKRGGSAGEGDSSGAAGAPSAGEEKFA